MCYILNILPIALLSIGLVICAFEIRKLRESLSLMQTYFNNRMLKMQFPEVYRQMEDGVKRHDAN